MSEEQEKLVSEVEALITREDGSQVKIKASTCYNINGHNSAWLDVFRRENSSAKWKLCSDRKHPDWRTMSVDRYVKEGRSEQLQYATPGEILKAISMLGKPVTHVVEGN